MFSHYEIPSFMAPTMPLADPPIPVRYASACARRYRLSSYLCNPRRSSAEYLERAIPKANTTEKIYGRPAKSVVIIHGLVAGSLGNCSHPSASIEFSLLPPGQSRFVSRALRSHHFIDHLGEPGQILFSIFRLDTALACDVSEQGARAGCRGW